MKGFLDPKIEQLLENKSDTERLQAIVFSIACLLNGPTAFQPPDFYHIPKRAEPDSGDLEDTEENESDDAMDESDDAMDEGETEEA